MNSAWWVVDALDKVFPESTRPVDARTSIALKAARNETEDGQVVIAVPAKQRAKKASFAFTALRGPGGHSIRKEHLSARWQWYTYVHANPPANVDPTTYLRKAPAFFPDAFLEETEVGLRGGAAQPVWISVFVPPDTPPGTYQGSVAFTLEYQNGAVTDRIRVPITVEVWPFELPAKPSLHHTEWFFPGILADYYHIEQWSDAHWTWIDRVARDMAAHKQDMILTPLTSLVQMTAQANGRLDFDFTRLDRWLDIFQRAGVEWIEGGHIAGRCGNWESPILYSRWSPRDTQGKPVNTGRDHMPEAEFERYVEQLLRAVYRHLRTRGLAHRYVQHVADEPIRANAASWSRIARQVHRWLPEVRRIDALMAEGMDGDCEIRVPQIQEITSPSRRRFPEEVWSYTCLAPQGIYPNRFLDYPSIRNRILFWLSYTLNLRGFLHWGYNHWTVWCGVPVNVPLSPWMDATGASHYCVDTQPLPAGDPHIVYPGRNSICSSIRWETVRKGFEDYEYLKLLETLLRHRNRSAAHKVTRGRDVLARVQALAPDPARHTHSAQQLQATRIQIGQAIAALSP